MATLVNVERKDNETHVLFLDDKELDLIQNIMWRHISGKRGMYRNAGTRINEAIMKKFPRLASTNPLRPLMQGDIYIKEDPDEE